MSFVSYSISLSLSFLICEMEGTHPIDKVLEGPDMEQELSIWSLSPLPPLRQVSPGNDRIVEVQLSPTGLDLLDFLNATKEIRI